MKLFFLLVILFGLVQCDLWDITRLVALTKNPVQNTFYAIQGTESICRGFHECIDMSFQLRQSLEDQRQSNPVHWILLTPMIISKNESCALEYESAVEQVITIILMLAYVI